MHKWIFIFFSIISFSTPSFAGKILKVKGKNVVIDVSGEDVSSGSKIDIYKNNKRRGVVKIRKINKKKTKALGRIILGKAKQGWLATNNPPLEEGLEGAKTVESKMNRSKKLNYGALFGFSMDSMTISLSSDVDLSGSGFSIKGGFDYQIGSSFQIRGKTGAEMFSASGDNTNATVANGECSSCEVDITYFTLEGLGQYYLSKNKYSFWIGGGAALAHPLSSSSNAIDANSLSTTTALQFGGGMDIRLKSGSYIPLEVLYSSLPKSDSVQATYITLSAGYFF